MMEVGAMIDLDALAAIATTEVKRYPGCTSRVHIGGFTVFENGIITCPVTLSDYDWPSLDIVHRYLTPPVVAPSRDGYLRELRVRAPQPLSRASQYRKERTMNPYLVHYHGGAFDVHDSDGKYYADILTVRDTDEFRAILNVSGRRILIGTYRTVRDALNDLESLHGLVSVDQEKPS